jgi:RNA polymerase sigma factor (sigma-70 family)
MTFREYKDQLTTNSPTLFSEVYSVCHDICVGYLLKTFNNLEEEEAKDIYTDALVHLKGIPVEKIDGSSNMVSTYLVNVSDKKARSFLRDKEKRKTEDFFDNLAKSYTTLYPDEALEKEYLLELLEACLNKLNDTEKNILSKYYWDDKPMKMIGKEMDKADTVVKATKFKCIIKLKDCIFSKLKKEDNGTNR